MTLVLTEDHGPVRHLILNRPEKRNAFNGELIAATGEALREAGAEVVGVAAIVDRDTGARERIAETGLEYRWAYDAADLGL